MDNELTAMMVGIFGALVCLIDDLADQGIIADSDRDWYFYKLSPIVGFDINGYIQEVKDARQRT
jgi:hypothetical protein